MSNYINKKEMTEELLKYRDSARVVKAWDKKNNCFKDIFKDGVISDKLHMMFLEMSRRLINKRGSKSFNCANYTQEYKEDMVSYGYMRCLTYGVITYDVTKNMSPLAYFTQTIINEYKAFLKLEKRFQTRKWTELDRYVQGLESDYQIQLDMGKGIRERMYNANMADQELVDFDVTDTYDDEGDE